MQRRDFIIQSGTFLTASSFFGALENTNVLFGQTNASDVIDKDKRPHPNNFAQPILKAIAVGINAPSPHNTQSWKFKIIDDYSMYLYVDENRFLPATDPTNRQIHIGAGCFIETLAIGATGLGYVAAIEYFPEGYSSKADFGKKPVAKISLAKNAGDKSELEAFIAPRHTNRKEYKGASVSKVEFDLLISATGATHSKIGFIEDDSKFKEYKRLLIKAMEVESYKYDAHDESRKMMRFSEKERAEKRDGLSIPQVGFTGIMVPLAEMSLKGGPEKWHSEKSLGRHFNTFNKAVNSAKGIVTFTTESNEIIDWIKTGRDFVKFGLSLTKYDLYNNPHTQITQEYPEMLPVMAELNKLENISEPHKVQLILRIGRAVSSYYSYRRHLEDFLVK